MKVAGLFSGVGGLELGLEQSGHKTILMCEIDKHAQAVLKCRFPGVRLYGDIADVHRLPNSTDMIAAGFPCQDLSQAGRTAGLRGQHSGLVRRVFQLLEAQNVPWVLLENVPNMLRLNGGAALKHIVRKLEKLGYAWAYRVIDARAFGLAQRRLRVFILASRVTDPATLLLSDSETPCGVDAARKSASCDSRGGAPAYGFYWTEGNRGVGWTFNGIPTLKAGSTVGIPSPPAVWFPRRSVKRAFVTPGVEDAEELQGFERGWTRMGDDPVPRGVRWRMVGNAVSVPIARWIGERLMHDSGESNSRERLYWTAPLPDAAHGYPNGRRFRSSASTWPVSAEGQTLSRVLQDCSPLSARAAQGFLGRLQRSNLRIAPDEFRRALASYVRMRCDEDVDFAGR